jgi:FkbM family methyltransferase
MIKRAINNILGKAGLEIRRVSRRDCSQRQEHYEIPSHVMADLVIDVGVAGGTPWLYQRFPHADLVLVDPLLGRQEEYEGLGGRKCSFFRCAAGSSGGAVYINEDIDRPALSSLLDRTPLTARDHKIVQKEVPVRALDDIVEEVGAADKAIGLKIDVEGYEMEVLKGSKNVLKQCSFVVCEVSVEQRFYASYSFSELISWIYAKNFGATKVLGFSVDGNGVIRMADILFERLS